MEKFLELLDSNYYIFGGKALSILLKNVESYDWDVVIDSKYENLESVLEKVHRAFGDGVDCQPQSFTRERVGYHTTIYGCSLNGMELLDFKFEDIGDGVPIVIIDGINYLDIDILYNNLVESIDDNLYILDMYDSMKKKLEPEYINSIIQNEVDELKEMLEDAEDDEEVDDIRQDIEEARSQDNYNKIKEEIIENMNVIGDNVVMARKLVEKNRRRLDILKNAINNPMNFTVPYLSHLCSECIKTGNEYLKIIDGIALSCKKTCPVTVFDSYNRIYGRFK